MPENKDLKRLVRARMQKTGEAYTSARLQLRKKVEPPADLSALAGFSEASVKRATGRGWSEWVGLLDGWKASSKPHREIAEHVCSLGTPEWWSQMVTVGYERIRGLREKGQRREGEFRASKSRTFKVTVETLYDAFAKARPRSKWLPVKIATLSATPNKRMRIAWADSTEVQIEFSSKGTLKSTVAVEHQKLPTKAAVAEMKKLWSEYFERLSELLS